MILICPIMFTSLESHCTDLSKPKGMVCHTISTLKSLEFNQSSSDAYLFVLQSPVQVIMLVYVDDILVSGPNSSICNKFIHKLSTLFPIKDLGPFHYFMGLEVHRTNDGLFLHQGKYLLDLLQKNQHGIS